LHDVHVVFTWVSGEFNFMVSMFGLNFKNKINK
jgi:hypothetical protein